MLLTTFSPLIGQCEFERERERELKEKKSATGLEHAKGFDAPVAEHLAAVQSSPWWQP